MEALHGYHKFPELLKDLHSIFCTNANICYAVGDSGIVLKTINGGVGINDVNQKKMK